MDFIVENILGMLFGFIGDAGVLECTLCTSELSIHDHKDK